MKKIIALLLAAVMCFAFVACGGSNSENTPANADATEADVLTKDVSEIRGCTYRIITHGVRIIVISVITITIMIITVDFKLTAITIIPIIVTTYLIIKINLIIKIYFNIL